jgi:hypothetical protein
MAFAQGDGPRTWLLAPKGIWGVDAKWINLDQNIVPAGNLFIPTAAIKVNVFPITLFHTFSIGGHFAQAMFNFVPGTANGNVYPPLPNIPNTTFKANGYSDGFVALKVGLVGAPALKVIAFTKKPPAFSMIGMLRIWYSGTYSDKKALNLGTNRVTYEIGLPMSIPFGKDAKKPFWLEVAPSVQFYTINSNPTIISRASESKQNPLFLIENHLTKNLSAKFWAGIDVRFQSGGALKLDGVDQNNRLTILGGGLSAGYQLLPPLGIKASYGNVFWGYNGAQSRMFRIGATFTYANLKK